MDLQKLRADLVARRGDWKTIRERTGLSMSWLSKFANDKIGSPRIITAEKLEAALTDREAQ